MRKLQTVEKIYEPSHTNHNIQPSVSHGRDRARQINIRLMAARPRLVREFCIRHAYLRIWNNGNVIIQLNCRFLISEGVVLSTIWRVEGTLREGRGNRRKEQNLIRKKKRRCSVANRLRQQNAVDNRSVEAALDSPITVILLCIWAVWSLLSNWHSSTFFETLPWNLQ